MMRRGFFVSIEGIDGAGKSTLVAALGETLRVDGLTVRCTREPGTEVGQAIRSILLDHFVRPVAPMAELLLYLADRAQQVAEVIRPALLRGEHVLTDRYLDTTIAYQAYGRRVASAGDVAAWEAALGSRDVRPDLTVVLDCPAFVGIKRIRHRSTMPDRLEREGVEYFARVRRGYATLAAAEPGRFVVLDAMRPAALLHDQVAELVRARLEARGGPR